MTLLRGGTLVELAPARLERSDLRILGGDIVERGKDLAAMPGEEILDLAGKIVLPGMVCAHTHLYSALSCGMPGPAVPPANFVEILERVWWKLDRALDLELVRLSAQVGILEAIRSGTTTLVDHHSSPNAVPGSLGAIGRTLGEAGLRGILCYEVSDRDGTAIARQGLEETRRFLREDQGPRLRGLVGAHATFTLGPSTLAAVGSLAQEFDVGVHIHAAEDMADVEDASWRYGKSVIGRLADAGCLGPRTILAHGTHLSEADLALAREHRSWLVHNPRSNMNNQVGYAPVSAFGAKAALGTDGIGADMFAEAKFAFFKARDARQRVPDVLELVAGGARLAGEAFGITLGQLAAGAAADLVILDYVPPTPLRADNLAGHFLFGMDRSTVASVMVDGRWVYRNRLFLGLDAEAVYARAREGAARLWKDLP